MGRLFLYEAIVQPLAQSPLDQALKNHFEVFPVSRGETLLAAVSGGADSLALLASMQTFAQTHGFKLAALHGDHGLRGHASKADADYVKKLCKRWRVPLVIYRGKLNAKTGIEEKARAWRLACYARAIKKFKARRVFLGHHAADQAETLLLNLIRGSGVRGAGGMRPESKVQGLTLARPFLELDPRVLKNYLKSMGVHWREDASNATALSKRNVLRHKALPLFEKVLPGAILRLAAFTRRIRDLGEVVRELGEEKLLVLRQGQALDLPGFKKLSPALKPLLLMLWIMALQPRLALDEALLARALALAEAGQGRTDLKQGFYLEIRRKRLHLRR